MYELLDPRTAMDLARETHAERIRQVAEHRRYLDARLPDASETRTPRRAGARPARLIAALRRRPEIA